MEYGDVIKKITALGKELPHFPDGRIDYTNASYAPVVCVFIRFGGDVLLFKRSNRVGNYRGQWNAITGFLDRVEPPEKKALDEVEEEAGIGSSFIGEVLPGKPYELPDKEIKKTWLVCPFVVELNSKPEVRLDFESTEYRWIRPEQLKSPDTVMGLDRGYAACLS